ncbi:MAG: DUF362 domain-containing protein [Verrucomicrobia bacterium]|nr:DUF362 domain-containing protein [Verrucomicrobiota bacterium]MBU1734399.1 DUF362 domain-containing protein [Verrucomicrobiota bacterium]MBU1855687.1 DUF362 domain-containing protein [Verrucomicrobiota bacterium]
MRTKVALSACPDYSPANVQAAVERLVADLGGRGLATWVRPGQTVLLKPNMLSARTPEQAVTTHPEVVRALIRMVKAVGGRPIVADSACNAIQIERVWEKTGFKAMCGEESVPLVNLEKSSSVQFNWAGVVYSVAKPVLDAALVINMPKLKTHLLTVLTNAIKNIYGTLPGFQKTMLHKQYPTPDQFCAFLAELYVRVKPGLTICDAVVAMEGNGPSAGELVLLGFLAGSTDGVALDAAMCHILKIALKKVSYLGLLQQAGVGVADWSQIELVGNVPLPLQRPPYRVPATTRLLNWIPIWLVRMLAPYVWIRPSFTARCVKCGLCVKACPVTALRIADGPRPVLNPAACIGCCCCHEVCPQRAVNMTQSFLLNLRKRGKLPS